MGKSVESGLASGQMAPSVSAASAAAKVSLGMLIATGVRCLNFAQRAVSTPGISLYGYMDRMSAH